MKHGGKVAICLAGGLALNMGAHAVNADSPDNPYSGIVERNVFALKPAPPPPSAEPPPAPPQKIILTGIMNAWGKKQVFFKTPPTGRPGEAAKETTYMLSEGERAGEIEVVEINVVAGTVKFKNHGQPDDRSLEKDGMKPQGGGGGAVPGSMPMAAGGFPAVPNMAAPNFGTPAGGVPAAPASSMTPVPTLGGGGAAAVQRPLRIVPPQSATAQALVQAQPQRQAPPPVISHEEQVALMEIHRVTTAPQVASGELPPLPPTEATPPGPEGQ